jgi:hypothetical protein
MSFGGLVAALLIIMSLVAAIGAMGWVAYLKERLEHSRWLPLALPGPKKHHREWLHLPELVMENIISFCDGPTLG